MKGWWWGWRSLLPEWDMQVSLGDGGWPVVYLGDRL